MESSRIMKNTPAGLFPEDWVVVQLGTKASVFRGGSPRPIDSFLTNDPDGINWIKIGDVAVGAKYIKQTEEKIIPEGAARSRKVNAGDFLLSNSMSFGRPYILQIDGCIHDGWLVIQEYYDTFETDYLYYALNAGYVLEQYKSMAAGSSVLNLNKDIVKRVHVAVPSRSEQKIIADALSGVDNMIGALDEAITKKRQIKEGLMQQLMTGKTRLPGFSGEWVELELGAILSYEQPGPFLVHSTDYVETGIPVLTAGKTFILGYTNENFGIYDKLPVIIFDDFVTESKFVDFPFKAKSSAMKMLSLRDKTRHNIRFIYDVMQLIDFPMTDHKRWWIAEYSHLKVRVPASIEEENAIANTFSSIDAEIHSLESQRDKYRLIKQGMMQELLTGKTRLI